METYFEEEKNIIRKYKAYLDFKNFNYCFKNFILNDIFNYFQKNFIEDEEILYKNISKYVRDISDFYFVDDNDIIDMFEDILYYHNEFNTFIEYYKRCLEDIQQNDKIPEEKKEKIEEIFEKYYYMYSYCNKLLMIIHKSYDDYNNYISNFFEILSEYFNVIIIYDDEKEETTETTETIEDDFINKSFIDEIETEKKEYGMKKDKKKHLSKKSKKQEISFGQKHYEKGLTKYPSRRQKKQYIHYIINDL